MPTNEANLRPAASAYAQRVDRIVDRMDLVLERGRETQRRCESFYTRHGLQPGFGEQRLTDPGLPERVTRSTRAALALQQAVLDACFPSGGREPSRSESPASATATAAVRALRSHCRI
jgi:hypothetical protein